MPHRASTEAQSRPSAAPRAGRAKRRRLDGAEARPTIFTLMAGRATINPQRPRRGLGQVRLWDQGAANPPLSYCPKRNPRSRLHTYLLKHRSQTQIPPLVRGGPSSVTCLYPCGWCRGPMKSGGPLISQGTLSTSGNSTRAHRLGPSSTMSMKRGCQYPE